MKYHVEIHYKDLPNFQLTVEARNRYEAEFKAKSEARFMGFTGAIKKYVVRRVENETA